MSPVPLSYFWHNTPRCSHSALYLTFIMLFGSKVTVTAITHSPQCTTKIDGAEGITNCSGLGLSSVPDDLDPLTTELYLDNNNISTIKNNSFSYLRHLRTLSMQNNGMVEIKAHGLAGLVALDVLELSNNALVSITAESLDNCNPNVLIIDDNYFTEETLQRLSSALAGKRLSRFSVKRNPTFVNITQNTFKPLSNLQFLDISGCDIKSLPRSAFNGFSRLEELYIENNTNLVEIDDNAFLWMQQLKTLSLAGCGLKRVTNFLKEKANELLSLKYVDLSRNKISSIQEYSFYPMRYIEHLDLSQNQFTHFTIYFEFVGLTGLKYLDISKNPLTDIQNRAFSGISAIETLDMSDCLFRGLVSEELWGLYTLQNLYLNNNPLTFLSRDVFKTQSSISEIYLSNCRLTEMTTSFKGLNFTKIVADNNKIATIASDAFDGCVRLNELHFQGNKLPTFPEAVCRNPTVKNVDLSNNILQTIDSKITDDCLRKWSVFDGSKNPFRCDGKLVDFTLFANSTGMSVVQQWPDGYRCYTPREWQNVTVHDYINTQWLTTTTTTTTTVTPTTDTLTTIDPTITATPTTEKVTTFIATTEQTKTRPAPEQTTADHMTTSAISLTSTANKPENTTGPNPSGRIGDRDIVIITLSTVLGIAFIAFLIVIIYIAVFKGHRRNKSWTVNHNVESDKQSYHIHIHMNHIYMK